MSVNKGLRAVALFEAIKGGVVLAAGAGALSLLHRDAQQIAERIVRHLQLDPTAHYAGIFIKLASRINDQGIWLLALTALAYSTLRFVEAYGLWKARTWAEWVAVLSGALYIPFELVEIWKRVTWIKLSLLAINLVIVLYVAKLLVDSRNRALAGRKAQAK